MLRWGLAFVFFYAAIAALARPDHWGVFVPYFVSNTIGANLFLSIVSAYELLLAIWLVWGKKLSWVALLSAITFTVVVVVDLSRFGDAFQDVGLACASLALFEMSRHDVAVHHNHA